MRKRGFLTTSMYALHYNLSKQFWLPGNDKMVDRVMDMILIQETYFT